MADIDRSVWHDCVEAEVAITPGMRVEGEFGTIRVMAVTDRYAMVRYPRRVPFVLSLKDISAMMQAHADNQAFYREAGMKKRGTRG